MIGLIVLVLMVFHTCGELVPWGVGPIYNTTDFFKSLSTLKGSADIN